MAQGSLIVVSAPSGAGKTTLCQMLAQILPGLMQSVSYTTRKPRPGELSGVHYHFVPEKEFEDMAQRGEFVEWARVHGNLYGTSENDLREIINTGADAILDIDTQGAREIKKKFPDAVFIFILPPSIETLRRRLEGRMSDSAQEISRRLEKALDEIKDYKLFDYVIVNDMLEDALESMKAIVLSSRFQRAKLDVRWVEENFFG